MESISSNLQSATLSDQKPLADITSSVNVEDCHMTPTEKVVTKRNGESQTLSVVKIRSRLELLMEGLNQKHIDLALIIDKTVAYAQNGRSDDFLRII